MQQVRVSDLSYTHPSYHPYPSYILIRVFILAQGVALIQDITLTELSLPSESSLIPDITVS